LKHHHNEEDFLKHHHTEEEGLKHHHTEEEGLKHHHNEEEVLKHHHTEEEVLKHHHKRMQDICSLSQEEQIDWQVPSDTRPPEPIFNNCDNLQCVNLLSEWYSQAVEFHDKNSRINKSYTDVLER